MILKNRSSRPMRLAFEPNDPREEKKNGYGGVRRNKSSPIARRERLPDVRDLPSFELTTGKKTFLEHMLPTLQQEKEGNSTMAITNQAGVSHIPVDEVMTDADERHFDPLRFERAWKSEPELALPKNPESMEVDVKLEPELALPKEPELMEVDVPGEAVVDHMQVDEEVKSSPVQVDEEVKSSPVQVDEEVESSPARMFKNEDDDEDDDKPLIEPLKRMPLFRCPIGSGALFNEMRRLRDLYPGYSSYVGLR